MEPTWIIIPVVLGIIALVIYGQYRQAQRRMEMAAWAGRHGLSFSPEKDSGMDDRYDQFDCLRRGDNRYACNIAQGNWGSRPVTCFDYHYETHSTDAKGNRQTQRHSFSAVIMGCPFSFPLLIIRPEGFFDKVKGFFGAEDINFESAEFSRRFFVKCQDRKFAYDVIHQRVMEFLLGSPNFHITFSGNCAIVFRDDCFAATKFDSAAGVLAGILDQLPEYLLRQRAGGASP